jgi:E3 ubiquitin-protein ligase HERC3
LIPPDAALDGDVGTGDAGDAGATTAPLEIAVGGVYSCAIATIGAVDGSLKCWGANNGGTLGLGDIQSRGGAPGQMGANLPVVDLGPGARVVEIGAGFDAMVCARLNDGRVKCWGRNDSGRLGTGDPLTRGDEADEMGANLPAVDLGPGRKALQIALGVSHACARLDDATLKCWGMSAFGALGLGDMQVRGFSLAQMGANLPALDLGPGRTARQLSAGGAQTCVILDDDSIKCWGFNEQGQLGLGDVLSRGGAAGQMGASLPAVALGLGRTARQVSVGFGSTCAILDNGSVKCWGFNDQGQLGQGDVQARGDGPGEMGDNLPTVDLGAGRTALQVASGLEFACALLDDRTVKCWGRNDLGQLGLGDQQDRGDNPGEMGAALPTVDLGPGRKALQISAGSYACAKLDDGSVKCWGSNGSGELGLGDLVSRGDNAGEMGANLPAVQLQ